MSLRETRRVVRYLAPISAPWLVPTMTSTVVDARSTTVTVGVAVARMISDRLRVSAKTSLGGTGR
jgi:hypothetical protein